MSELIETEDTKVRDLLIAGKLQVRENASGLRDRLEVRGYRRPVGCSARLFSKFPLDDPFLEPGESRFAGYRPVYVHGRFVRLKDANKSLSELDKMRSGGAEARPKAQRYAPGSDPAHTPAAKTAPAAPAAPKGPPKGLPEQFASRWGSMYEAGKASTTAAQQETPPIKTANAAIPTRRQAVAAASSNTGRVRAGRQGGGAASSNERAKLAVSAGDAQTQATLDRQREAATGFVPRKTFREVVHDPAAAHAARAAESAIRARQEQAERRVAELAAAEERSRAKAKERQEIERARAQAEDAEKQVAAAAMGEPPSAPEAAPAQVEEQDPLALLEARPFESLSNAEKTQLMLLRRERASTGFVPARRPAYQPGADGAAAELPPQPEATLSSGSSGAQRPARGSGEDLFGGDTRLRMARKPRVAKVSEASASMDDFFGAPAAPPAAEQPAPAPAASLDDLLGPAPAPKAEAEAEDRPWIPESMRGARIDPRTEAALKKRWEANTGFTPSRRPTYQPGADGQALAAPSPPSSDAAVSRSPRGASGGGGLDSLFGGGGDTRVRMPSRKKSSEPT